MPDPHERAVSIYSFVDAKHAGNIVTMHSNTGIIMFIQNKLIIWFLKKNNTVKEDTLGSKLVALRIYKELIVVLRSKLRMFGVRLEGPEYFFCDNGGVVKNMIIQESVLPKKHNVINYHLVRDAVVQIFYKLGKSTEKIIWRIC